MAMRITYIQGKDFKAKCWARAMANEVNHFTSQMDLLLRLLRLGRGLTADIIFRYQNSEKTTIGDILALITLAAIVAGAKFKGFRIFWVMHNVDGETVNRHPIVTGIKRWILYTSAYRVLVLDSYLKDNFFAENQKVSAISFGKKEGGILSERSRKILFDVRNRFDLVVLMLGAEGRKYRHFQEAPFFERLAKERGKTIVFMVPLNVTPALQNFEHLPEENICEREVADYVDCIYRANDDISIPYTLYAAATAGIPLVSSPKYFTYKLIRHYGIGLSEADFLSAGPAEIKAIRCNMEKFLRIKHWDSLGKATTGS